MQANATVYLSIDALSGAEYSSVEGLRTGSPDVHWKSISSLFGRASTSQIHTRWPLKSVRTSSKRRVRRVRSTALHGETRRCTAKLLARTLALEDERSHEHVLLRAVDGGQLSTRVRDTAPLHLSLRCNVQTQVSFTEAQRTSSHRSRGHTRGAYPNEWQATHIVEQLRHVRLHLVTTQQHIVTIIWPPILTCVLFCIC